VRDEERLTIPIKPEPADHLPGARARQKLDELACALEIALGVLAWVHDDDVIRALENRITLGGDDQIELDRKCQVRRPVRDALT
jgi:hypothetical protein